ncbi:MAG: hypothetical protein V4509_04665 [Patescibacteria group bacterium]
MKIPKKGSSMKQLAYARRVWGAEGSDKKSIALDVGYSPAVANSVVSKIESRKGFNNAIAQLAADSNNMALTVMSEFKARGLEDFSNKDLVSALNAIAGAWDKFNKGFKESIEPKEDNGKNRLRTVVLQNINKQVNITSEETATVSPKDEATPAEFEEVQISHLDF